MELNNGTPQNICSENINRSAIDLPVTLGLWESGCRLEDNSSFIPLRIICIWIRIIYLFLFIDVSIIFSTFHKLQLFYYYLLVLCNFHLFLFLLSFFADGQITLTTQIKKLNNVKPGSYLNWRTLWRSVYRKQPPNFEIYFGFK